MSNELTAKTGNFDEIISIIDNARNRAVKAVNAELIQMYWNVGEYLSELCAKEHYSKRELDRQISSAYYERYMCFYSMLSMWNALRTELT